MLIRKETKTRTVTVNDIVYTHKCEVCGKEYTSQYEWMSRCSNACYDVIRERRRKAAIKRSTQKRKERREILKISRPDKICENCQESFRPVRNDTKYCSDKCKQAAYRKRKNENQLQLNQLKRIFSSWSEAG